MRNNIQITRVDLKIYISPLDVDLIGCFNGASSQWEGPMCKLNRREDGPETVYILSWWPQNKNGVKLLGGIENG